MRRRLIVVAAAISTMVAVGLLVPLVVLVRTVARDRAITNAERDAGSVASFVAVSSRDADLVTALSNNESGRDGRMTIALASGTELGPAIPHDDDLRLAQQGTSFSASHSGGTA